MSKKEKMVELEIELDDDELLFLAMLAHDKDITLNQLINEVLANVIEENKL